MCFELLAQITMKIYSKYEYFKTFLSMLNIVVCVIFRNIAVQKSSRVKEIPVTGKGHISRHNLSLVVTSILLVGRPSSSTQIVFCFETKISRLNGMGQLCLSQRDGNVYKNPLWFRPGFTQSPFADLDPGIW
jgi:hypothetical protein